MAENTGFPATHACFEDRYCHVVDERFFDIAGSEFLRRLIRLRVHVFDARQYCISTCCDDGARDYVCLSDPVIELRARPVDANPELVGLGACCFEGRGHECKEQRCPKSIPASLLAVTGKYLMRAAVHESPMIFITLRQISGSLLEAKP